MKLLTKLNRKYIVWSLIVMAFSAVAIYFILLVIINSQLDERLTENLQTVEKQLKQAPDVFFVEPVVKVQRIEKISESVAFSDTLIYNENENEYEDYRQISAVKNIGGNYYKIILRKSKIESEDFLLTLAMVTFTGIILLWLILFVINRRITKSLWEPFFANLKIIEQFSVTTQKPLKLKNSGILEFDKLNSVITSLTQQIINDFQNQKQFSEDVSHELQTPIAIICYATGKCVGRS